MQNAPGNLRELQAPIDLRAFGSRNVSRVAPYPGASAFLEARHAFRAIDWSLYKFDPDGLRYATTISVRAHWLAAAFCLVSLVYRPHYEVATYGAYALIFLALTGCNGYLHYRLRSNRPTT